VPEWLNGAVSKTVEDSNVLREFESLPLRNFPLPMENFKNIQILFVAGFGPISREHEPSRAFYSDTLGIPFKEMGDGYLHTQELTGTRYFAIWPLDQAAESCFGASTWPSDKSIPQAWIEFDVEDIAAATKELKDQGYDLLVAARVEPWGQTVTRLLSPEGLLVGITHTPWQRS
jgi:hypothetical protein